MQTEAAAAAYEFQSNPSPLSSTLSLFVWLGFGSYTGNPNTLPAFYRRFGC